MDTPVDSFDVNSFDLNVTGHATNDTTSNSPGGTTVPGLCMYIILGTGAVSAVYSCALCFVLMPVLCLFC